MLKRATIADVATRAGVSKSTVSHALSGKRPISVETRERIQQAIQELEYEPHPVAQQLAGGRTSRTIAFVFPLFSPRIASLEMKFIAGAASAINEAGYAFHLITHTDRNYTNLQRFVNSGLVDGVILMQVNLHDSRVEMLKRLGIPFVLIGRCADNTGLVYVDAEIERGIQQGVDHLVNLQHRTVAYLHQPTSDFGFSTRALEAYHTACQTHGLPNLAVPCELSSESGRTAMATLLAYRPDLTSVIVWNDVSMWGAIQAIQDHGLQVPADFSIICFHPSSDAQPATFKPTVVDIQAEEIAARAARVMIDLLESDNLPQPQILIPPRLIAGDSTVTPRAI